MLISGIIIGILMKAVVDEIIYHIEERKQMPTLEELNAINRKLYAEDRAQLAENMRQIKV